MEAAAELFDLSWSGALGGPVQIGVMFFGSRRDANSRAPYELVLAASELADRCGFSAAWFPERHFDDFGALYPSPAVLAAAVAVRTQRIILRSGSVITPLHDTLRIAEDWAVVDGLSGGRVELALGSGWNVDDFVFFPERYSRRREVMWQQRDELCNLWRGAAAKRSNSFGKELAVRLRPRPVQPELPLWITSSGAASTVEQAAQAGHDVLTHMLGRDLDDMAEVVERFRMTRAAHGHGRGRIAVMVHTYVGHSQDQARALVEGPMRAYLRDAVALELSAARGGGQISGGHELDLDAFDAAQLHELVELRFERYFEEASLLGGPDRCLRMLNRLADIGVDEAACLIDFGLTDAQILDGLGRLAELHTRLR